MIKFLSILSLFFILASCANKNENADAEKFLVTEKIIHRAIKDREYESVVTGPDFCDHQETDSVKLVCGLRQVNSYVGSEYEKHLASHPTLVGPTVILLEFEKSGMISNAIIESSPIKGEPSDNSLISKIKSIRIKPLSKPLEIRYTFDPASK